MVRAADGIERVTNNPVIIAGGGIGGLATALTLHQIGVPCIVFEAVREMRPLGVGINLQPNAVRELYDLGITAGRSRPRRPAGQGMGAGRAQRQRHLFRAARAARRLQLAAIRGASRPASTCCCTTRWWSGSGRRRCRLGSRVTGYRKNADGGVTALDRTRRRLDLRGERRAADRRRRHPLGGPRADASRRSRRSTGAARSCGAAPPGRSRSAPARPSSASARIASAWCSIRSRIPTRRPASR